MIRTCRCGKEFEARRSWHRFCSPACRKAAFMNGSGEVASVRQTKTGWSMTLHFTHRPATNTGEFVTIMRS